MVCINRYQTQTSPNEVDMKIARATQKVFISMLEQCEAEFSMQTDILQYCRLPPANQLL